MREFSNFLWFSTKLSLFDFCYLLRRRLRGQRNGFRNCRHKVFSKLSCGLDNFLLVYNLRLLVSVISFICCHVIFLLIGNPNMVMALAGNKSDLLDARKVTAEVSKSYSVLTDFSRCEVWLLLLR